MRLRRRTLPSHPTLSEDLTLMLLTGSAPGVSTVRRLQFMSPHPDNYIRLANLWRTHESYLLAEAKRRGIARPPGGYVGEGIVALLAQHPGYGG